MESGNGRCTHSCCRYSAWQENLVVLQLWWSRRIPSSKLLLNTLIRTHPAEDFRAAGKSGSALEPSVENVKNGIRTGFWKVMNTCVTFQTSEMAWTGAVPAAVGVMISPKHIYFVTVAIRAVLYRSGQVCFSTQDHKPYSKGERANQIQEAA